MDLEKKSIKTYETFLRIQKNKKKLERILFDKLDYNLSLEENFFQGSLYFFQLRDLYLLDLKNPICVYKIIEIKNNKFKIKFGEFLPFSFGGLFCLNSGNNFSVYDIIKEDTFWKLKYNFGDFYSKSRIFNILDKLDL